jgi:hypothetical protein
MFCLAILMTTVRLTVKLVVVPNTERTNDSIPRMMGGTLASRHFQRKQEKGINVMDLSWIYHDH